MPRPARPNLLAALALSACAGCAWVPQKRLADCEQRVQVLEIETSQLRNEALSLRTRNRELATRAVTDAQRLRDLEVANRSLQSQLAARESTRAEIAQAFGQLQEEVLASGDGAAQRVAAAPPRAQAPRDPARFEQFARAQPGCRYDPRTGVWQFPESLLFEPGTDRLTPQAPLILAAFARLVEDSADPARINQIVSQEPGDPADDSLSLRRARRFREELASHLDIDPATIAATQTARAGGNPPRGQPASPALEVRLVDQPAADRTRR